MYYVCFVKAQYTGSKLLVFPVWSTINILVK